MTEAPPAATTPKKKSRPARIIGATAALLALAAIALIALGAIGLAGVATPNMQGFNSGASVAITDRGMSVYARSDDDRADTVCTADDGSATTLARPTGEFAVDVSGSDFYEVARTPKELTAGSYAVTCEGTAQALYVGPAAPNTTASGLMGPASLVGGIMLGLFALVLMIIAIVTGRSKAGQKTGEAAYPYQSYPAAGYPPAPGNAPRGQSPYGGASQQGYDAQPPPPQYGRQQAPPPYGAPPPPASDSYGQGYGQGDAYGQTAALPQQDPTQQSYAPPPPPGWGPPSGEPTQAIAYGQGHFDAPSEDQPQDQGPDDKPSAADDSEQDKMADMPDEAPAEHDEEPQEHNAGAQAGDSEESSDAEHEKYSEAGENQPFSYPPPPPPQ